MTGTTAARLAGGALAKMDEELSAKSLKII